VALCVMQEINPKEYKPLYLRSPKIKGMASIIDKLIGLGLMITALLFLKNKRREQPYFKAMGMSIDTICKLIYLGIAINALFLIANIIGWIGN
jgi:hypothetical protein